jgi:hypothetical protein
MNMNNDNPYLEEVVTIIVRKYNPDYGDNRVCICGHPYYRHFDTYDGMLPVGCKYCECGEFREPKPLKDGKHRCKCCGIELANTHLKVCDKCASEYEF